MVRVVSYSIMLVMVGLLLATPRAEAVYTVTASRKIYLQMQLEDLENRMAEALKRAERGDVKAGREYAEYKKRRDAVLREQKALEKLDQDVKRSAPTFA